MTRGFADVLAYMKADIMSSSMYSSSFKEKWDAVLLSQNSRQLLVTPSPEREAAANSEVSLPANSVGGSSTPNSKVRIRIH